MRGAERPRWSHEQPNLFLVDVVGLGDLAPLGGFEQAPDVTTEYVDLRRRELFTAEAADVLGLQLQDGCILHEDAQRERPNERREEPAGDEPEPEARDRVDARKEVVDRRHRARNVKV